MYRAGRTRVLTDLATNDLAVGEAGHAVEVHVEKRVADHRYPAVGIVDVTLHLVALLVQQADHRIEVFQQVVVVLVGIHIIVQHGPLVDVAGAVDP